MTLTGTGQMVGLVEFDGFYSSDIAAYAAAAGNGRTSIVIQTVLLDGYNGVPTTGSDSGNPEVSLDIEMAMAMAPGLSKIVSFEAGPNGLQNECAEFHAHIQQLGQTIELFLGLERWAKHDDGQHLQEHAGGGAILF